MKGEGVVVVVVVVKVLRRIGKAVLGVLELQQGRGVAVMLKRRTENVKYIVAMGEVLRQPDDVFMLVCNYGTSKTMESNATCSSSQSTYSACSISLLETNGS